MKYICRVFRDSVKNIDCKIYEIYTDCICKQSCVFKPNNEKFIMLKKNENKKICINNNDQNSKCK